MNRKKKKWKDEKVENVNEGGKLQRKIKKEGRNKQDEKGIWGKLKDINATYAKIEESKKQYEKIKLIL